MQCRTPDSVAVDGAFVEASQPAKNYTAHPLTRALWLFAALIFSVFTGSGQALAQDDESYILGSGDRIGIQVFDENELTMDSLIGDSGVINYSYLGNIQVAGKTTKELENDLIKLLQDGYLVNPSVNVSVVEYRPFFINGEVNNPGGYPYQPGLTLDKAVSLAGGLTDRASRRKMYLIKAGGDGKQIKVNMSARIQPGDVISIKEGFF